MGVNGANVNFVRLFFGNLLSKLRGISEVQITNINVVLQSKRYFSVVKILGVPNGCTEASAISTSAISFAVLCL